MRYFLCYYNNKKGEIILKNRIKKIRKELKMNQTKFGECIGVKQTTIAGYENGTRQPIDAVIASICREFNVSEEWLRTGKGEPFCPMDRQMEIAQLTNQLLTEADDSFKNIVISALSNTSEEDWKAFERFIDRIIEEKKKAE